MPRCDTMGLAARSGLLPLLGMWLFVGCASGAAPRGAAMEMYQKGETSPNVFLSTVIVRPEGCAPFGVACTMAGPGGAVLIMPFTEHIPGWMYEVFAHEMCHVVVAVRELPRDPCHTEDDGTIRVRRIGGQGSYYP